MKKIRVVAKETVFFDQVIEVTEAQYESLKDNHERGFDDDFRFIINTDEINERDDFEVIEFNIEGES